MCCNLKVRLKTSLWMSVFFALFIVTASRTFAQSATETESRLRQKQAALALNVQQYAASGKDPSFLASQMKRFESLMQTGRVSEAEKVLDSALLIIRNEQLKARKTVSQSAEPIPFTDEVQYLIFMLQGPGIYQSADPYAAIDSEAKSILEKIGPVGTQKRKVGFGVLLLPWMLEKAAPGKMEQVIEAAFRVARTRHMSILLSIETHYEWATRSDLWNCFDPLSPGFNPNNKQNVEWSDWRGTPYRHRYLDWGTPQEMAPPMCVNAPKIKSEIQRMIANVVGPAIRKGIDSLKKTGEENLFAGISVTSEPMIDNYSVVDKANQNLGDFMSKRGAPKLRLGYNALTQMGYSEKNPPKDIDAALAKVNQDEGAYWAEQFQKVGIQSSRLYTHVSANGGIPGTVSCAFSNAPISAAFNSYSRPGWTTYAQGPLKNGLQPVYTELAKHGNPHWGSSEASDGAFGGYVVPPYEYLRWHYGHGATLMVMNTGASSTELTKDLEQGVWGPDSIAAYRRFLDGR
jgi:hypothetical protein